MDITAIEAANGTGDINGSALTAIHGSAADVLQAIADLDNGHPISMSRSLITIPSLAESNQHATNGTVALNNYDVD